MSKYYKIIRLSKEDILMEFEDDNNFKKIKKVVEKMTDTDMKWLANHLCDDYCNQLFWHSLRQIFQDNFMDKK